MQTSSVAVHIPQTLYQRLEQAAKRLQKPVDMLLPASGRRGPVSLWILPDGPAIYGQTLAR